MAHLSINPHVSQKRLVALYKKYTDLASKAVDAFEKAEYESFVSTIEEFCMFRNGWAYLNEVRTKAKESEVSYAV